MTLGKKKMERIDIDRLKLVIDQENREMTSAQKYELEALWKTVVCPYKWNHPLLKEKPVFLKTLGMKEYHLQCEGNFIPLVQRLLCSIHALSEGEMKKAVAHLNVANTIWQRASNCDLFFKINKAVLICIMKSMEAYLYERKGIYHETKEILQRLQVIFTEDQILALRGIKGWSYYSYGFEGQIETLHMALDLKEVQLSPEWRFLIIELMVSLWDHNLSEEVVIQFAKRMEFQVMPNPEKPVRTFEKYFAATWEQRNVPEAIMRCEEALFLLPGATSAWEKRRLEDKVLQSLETDPLNKDILIAAAKFYTQIDEAHKALALYKMGRHLYRQCATSMFDILGLVSPQVEEHDVFEVIPFYSPKGQVPILLAAIRYLAAGADVAKARHLIDEVKRIEDSIFAESLDDVMGVWPVPGVSRRANRRANMTNRSNKRDVDQNARGI